MSYANIWPGTGCLVVVLILALIGLIAAGCGVYWMFQHIDFTWRAK